MKRITVVCSSINNRGIHRYAKGLVEVVRGAGLLGYTGSRWNVMWEMIGVCLERKLLIEADILIFANTRVSPLLSLLIGRKEVMVVCHDLMNTVWDSTRPARKMGLIELFWVIGNSLAVRFSFWRADLVIVNSYTTRKGMLEKLAVEDSMIEVVYPMPTFQGWFNVNSRDYSSKGRRNDVFSILVITGTSKNKNKKSYYELAQGLFERYRIRPAFNIVGNTSEDLTDEELELIARGNLDIRLLGRVKDEELIALYLGTSVFCSLSTDEGFGIPLDDALGFGIPCITSKIDAYNEVGELHKGEFHFKGDKLSDIALAIKVEYDKWSSSTHENDRSSRIDKYRSHSNRRSRLIEEQLGYLGFELS